MVILKCHVPEKLRSRELIDNTIKNISTVYSIDFPPDQNSKQTELINSILDELDRRLDVDTRSIREGLSVGRQVETGAYSEANVSKFRKDTPIKSGTVPAPKEFEPNIVVQYIEGDI